MQVQKTKPVKLSKHSNVILTTIPESWDVGILESITEPITKGTTPTTEGDSFTDQGILFFKAESFDDEGNIDLSKCAHISEKTHAKLRRSQLQPNDVLFTIAGTLGRICKIRQEHVPSNTNQAIAIIRVNDSSFNHSFLEYVLKSNLIQKQISIERTVMAQPNLSLAQVSNLKVIKPSPAEQQKIASILSNIDSEIQQTQKIIEQTQRLKKGLMQKLLTRGIGHTKFKHVKLIPKYLSFEIPIEWTETTFEEISKRITYGFTNPMPESNDGHWMITATNIKNGKINYHNARKTTRKAFEELLTDKSRPKQGSVLITKDGTLGEVAIVDRDNTCINQSVAFLEPDIQKILPEFLALSLQSQIIKKIIEVFSPQTTIRHISITDLAMWKLGLPSKEEQQKIVSIFDNCNSSLNETYNYKSNLESLKKGLMQKLLTGQMRVKV
jgi:type I restriction enzyme S subunit